MPDFYTEARNALLSLMQDSIGSLADGCRIQCPGKFSPACTAHAKTVHADAAQWCRLILRRLSESPVLIFGVPLIETVEEEDGFLNFYFTAAAYDAMIGHMLLELPPVTELALPHDEVSYASWRMSMLARKGASPIPDDPCVKKAAWLTLGVAEKAGEPRLLALRKREAAAALLGMSRRLPPRERPALQNRCGSLAECALRLLQL